VKSGKSPVKPFESAQSESVAKLAHEFRSRLAVIQGAIDNVLVGISGELNNEQKRSLQDAMGGVERLSNLVNNLLSSFGNEEGIK